MRVSHFICHESDSTVLFILSLFPAPIPQLFEFGVFAGSSGLNVATPSLPSSTLIPPVGGTTFSASVGFVAGRNLLPSILIMAGVPSSGMSAPYSTFVGRCEFSQIDGGVEGVDLRDLSGSSQLNLLGLDSSVLNKCKQTNAAYYCFVVYVSQSMMGKPLQLRFAYQYRSDVYDFIEANLQSSQYRLNLILPAPVPQLFDIGVFLGSASASTLSPQLVNIDISRTRDFATASTAPLILNSNVNLVTGKNYLPSIVVAVGVSPTVLSAQFDAGQDSPYLTFVDRCQTRIISQPPLADATVTIIPTADLTILDQLNVAETVRTRCSLSSYLCFRVEFNVYSVGMDMTFGLVYEYTPEAAASFASGDQWPTLRSSYYTLNFTTPYFSRDNNLTGILFPDGVLQTNFSSTLQSYQLILSASESTELPMLFSLGSPYATIPSISHYFGGPDSYISPFHPEYVNGGFYSMFGRSLEFFQTFQCGFQYGLSIHQLPFGSSTLVLSIKSQVLETKQWVFILKRVSPQLTSVESSYGILQPPFQPSVYSYVLTMPNTVENTNLTIAFADAFAAVEYLLQVNGSTTVRLDPNVTSIATASSTDTTGGENEAAVRYLQQHVIEVRSLPLGTSALSIRVQTTEAEQVRSYNILLARNKRTEFQVSSLTSTSGVSFNQPLHDDESSYVLATPSNHVSFQFEVPNPALTVVAQYFAPDGTSHPITLIMTTSPDGTPQMSVDMDVSKYSLVGGGRIDIQLVNNEFNENLQQVFEFKVGTYSINLVKCQYINNVSPVADNQSDCQLTLFVFVVCFHS